MIIFYKLNLGGQCTRVFLYDLSISLLEPLKKNYNLLLLIASSDELTKNILYHAGQPILSGTCMHEIYDFHLRNRGSCQAFDLLLESNEQLKLLFDNHQILQSANGEYSLSQLELLDRFELHKLAVSDQKVAAQVVNSPCIHKFKYSHTYLIDILLAYPELLDRFFKSQRPFYFDHHGIMYGCTQSHNFLLYILHSPVEFNCLNGYDIEELIEKDSETQEYIYRNNKLKRRHDNYKAFVTRLTDHTTIYSPMMEDIAELGISVLSSTLCHLSKTHDRNILAANAALLMDFHQWNDAFWIYLFSDISVEFFCAIYDKKSLRSGCYKHADKLCNRYFKAFEILSQAPDAQFSDEQLYDLQQKWLPIERKKVTEIFNKNPDLMQRWYKGYRIKKLHQSVIVSNYEEQQSLRNDSVPSSLQQCLNFNNIVVSEENREFILALVEQDMFDNSKQAGIYEVLLNQNQLTLVEFLKNNKNIALLREFDSLQEYFIANHTREVQDQLFEIINLCCKQNQFGDALTLFSLMYQSRLENNIDAPLPNYSEHQSECSNKLFYIRAVFTGLKGILIATDLDIASDSGSIMLSSAMATCALLVVFGTFKLYENKKSVDKPVTISYREALSRKNISMFFQAKLPVTSIDSSVQDHSVNHQDQPA